LRNINLAAIHPTVKTVGFLAERCVTFRRTLEEKGCEGLLGIDVNEKSIDLAIIKPDNVRFVKIDISEAKHIRDRYFKKRRSIQRRTRGKAKARLLAKYSGRERRRIDAVISSFKIDRFV
jgi:hypothetical protein